MTVTLTHNHQIVLPPRIRRKAGFKVGDELEVKAVGGIVTIISKPPANDENEYTPKQRRQIDARIAEALDDVKYGRLYGPFDTTEEMIASLKKTARKTPARKKTSKRSTK
jgi:AbrB family looped-hinge helix DNA binding protein